MFEVAITEPDRDVWNNGARHHEQKGM
jgi:hypothetical protein